MSAMDQSTLFLIIKIAAVGGWLALLFTLERWRPRALDAMRHPPPPDEGWFGWRRLMRNGVLWAGNILISPLIVLPITLLAAEAPAAVAAGNVETSMRVVDVVLSLGEPGRGGATTAAEANHQKKTTTMRTRASPARRC